MTKLNRTKSMSRFALSLCFVAALSACGGGGGSGGVESQQPLSDATVQGINSNPITAANPGTPEFTPSLGIALDVVINDPGLAVESSNDFIVAQWVHMQDCLQVSAQEPSVSVVEGKITPLTPNDDVVRFIDGQIQASSNVTDTNVTVQVRSADFDGSLGEPGFYLRSIMGRYLWLSNGLPERDYPHECASGS